MQYFSPQNAYSCSKDGILSALNSLFKVIDSVANIRIIGGEPLLFKDIAAVVAFLENENKVKSYNIVTNATIKPKDDLLSILSSSKKASVTISDYEKSPNLRIKLHKNELLRVLDERKIQYTVIWQDEDAAWFDPGAIYKRKRPRDKIVQNFRSCLMPCVSVMSNEFIGDFSENSHENLGENFNENSSLNLSKNLNSSDNLKLNFKQNLTLNSSKNSSKISASNLSKNSNFSENSSKKNQNSKGQIFICPVASSLSRLRGLREFEGDFLQIDDTLTKQKIIDFYAQDFFEVCDYCRDMWAPRKFVLPAIQSEKVLEIKE